MKDEIEAFLRRVAQVREAAEAQRQSKNRPPRPPAPPPAPRVAPRTQREDVVEAELADGQDMEREVLRHMRGTAEIAEHVRHLGEEVDQADEKLEAHLHQTFDHQLGDLKKTATDLAPRGHDAGGAEDLAGALLKSLRNPVAVRDAIVLSEVLRRPEERW